MKVSRLWRPVVHPWMLRPPAETLSLAAQLDGHLGRLDTAIGRGREQAKRLSVDGVDPHIGVRVGGVGGASSDGLPGGATATGPAEHDALGRIRVAVCSARDGFALLAAALEEHGGALAADLARYEALDPARAVRAHTLRAAIRARTDALSAADVQCRRLIEDAVRLVPTTIDVNAAGGWFAALAAQANARGVGGAGKGAVHPAATSTSPDAAGELTTPSATAPHPREALARLSAEQAHRRLRLSPDIARACADTTDPAAVPELTQAWRVTPSARRVAAVREAFEALTVERSRRLAVLYPGVVGPLDGAPPALRVTANRLLIRVELERARRSDIELESRAIARRVVDDSRWWRRLRAALTDAWLVRDSITAFVAVDSDRPLLVRRDLRVRMRLYTGLLYDRVDHGDGVLRERQIVLFDPTGRGRIAELWGQLGPATRHLAVFVPGTGTAVRGFHLPTDVAARLARAAAVSSDAGRSGPPARRDAAMQGGSAGSTTVVEAWMGADFPYSVGNQAVRSGYARRAAVPLRDHVDALRGACTPGPRPRANDPAAPASPDAPPADASAAPTSSPHEAPVVTVVGHSYGGTMVGAAELAGLACDRVLHLASPGAGPGVRSVDDYPRLDAFGRPRAPHRYEMTAPKDPIRLVQWASPAWRYVVAASRWRPRRALAAAARGSVGAPSTATDPTSLAGALFSAGGLGVAPARLRGIVRLDAGVWEEAVGGHSVGERLQGPSAHAGLTESGTTAFRRIVQVITAPPGQCIDGA